MTKVFSLIDGIIQFSLIFADFIMQVGESLSHFAESNSMRDRSGACFGFVIASVVYGR